jgi:hypothetical protein
MVGRNGEVGCNFLWGLLSDSDFDQGVVWNSDAIDLIEVVTCDGDLGGFARGKLVGSDLLDAGLAIFSAAIVFLENLL